EHKHGAVRRSLAPPPMARDRTENRDQPRDAADKDGDAAKRPTDKNYITPAGYRRLTEEFDFLRAKKRFEVVSALADAAAEGDRSENAAPRDRPPAPLPVEAPRPRGH